MKNLVESELEIFVGWIRERESVRARKDSGQAAPWTADPLLQHYRWCNVRRMDDRVSREMLEKWYQRDGALQDDVVAAVLGRLVNWPASLEDISGPARFSVECLRYARQKLAYRAAMGWKVFTGAYVVPGVPGFTKVDSVCNVADLVARDPSAFVGDSMMETWLKLVAIKGLGSFLAGQMVADMVHLKVGRIWQDVDTWAPIGPGSARGINRLLGIPKDKPVTQVSFERLLPELIAVVRPMLSTIWDDRRLQAMDIQNCLCEFDKYRRLTLKEGTVRARYDGVGQDEAQAQLI